MRQIRLLIVSSMLFFLFASYGFCAGEKININTATLEQLDQLPGVGKTIAQRIIDYRNKTPFKTIEEIKNVKGIGDKKFEKMKDLITVEGGAMASSQVATQPKSESKAKPISAPKSVEAPAPAGAKVNINTATADQLTQLPGIGRKE